MPAEARLVGGRYRLLSRLGQGGMGVVWRAHDEFLGREVAVKEAVLPAVMSTEERRQAHRRLLKEARAAARLSHPNIVTVHDVVVDDGRPWIVMELLQASSLEEVIRAEGPLAAQRVAEIGARVLAALRTAHAAGVLHRDIKPANVLLTTDGGVALTDFGIATIEGDATLTQSGLLVGSPGYMAPERLRGQRATPAADLWALGATLYTALEGRPPFDRPEPMAVLAAVLTEDPPPVRAGPLRSLIDALLRKDPAERWTAETTMRLLKEIAGTGPGDAAAESAKVIPSPLPVSVVSETTAAIAQDSSAEATWRDLDAPSAADRGSGEPAVRTLANRVALRAGAAFVLVALVAIFAALWYEGRSGNDPPLAQPTLSGNGRPNTTGTTATSAKADTITGVQVEGAFGKQPKVTIPRSAPRNDLTAETLIQGSGPVVRKGRHFDVRYESLTWSDGKVNEAWQDVGELAIGEGFVVPGWEKGLTGKRVGSRILLVAPPAELYDQQDDRADDSDVLVFVIDIVQARQASN